MNPSSKKFGTMGRGLNEPGAKMTIGSKRCVLAYKRLTFIFLSFKMYNVHYDVIFIDKKYLVMYYLCYNNNLFFDVRQ
jgi:hypothetical protein